MTNPWGMCCRKRAVPLPQTAVSAVVRWPLLNGICSCCLNPRVRRYVRNLIQYSLLLFVIIILILWIGMEVQEYHVHRSADTLSFYSGSQVCGLTYSTSTAATATGGGAVVFNSNETATTSSLLWTDDDYSSPAFLKIQTFASVENATFSSSHNNIIHNTNSTNTTNSTNSTSTTTIIAHCGDCGQCSNPQDVQIYDETRNTLLETSIYCAKRALIWGRKTTSKCLQEHVGLTDGCNDCWVENIMCDLRYCIFICFWHAIFNQLVSSSSSGSDAPQALNRCTLCDEKRCGPQFITCAGVNRRRSGILSDIERNEHAEVCRSVQPASWWQDVHVQELWQAQQQQQQQAQAQAQAQAQNTNDNIDTDDTDAEAKNNSLEPEDASSAAATAAISTSATSNGSDSTTSTATATATTTTSGNGNGNGDDRMIRGLLRR